MIEKGQKIELINKLNFYAIVFIFSYFFLFLAGIVFSCLYNGFWFTIGCTMIFSVTTVLFLYLRTTLFFAVLRISGISINDYNAIYELIKLPIGEIGDNIRELKEQQVDVPCDSGKYCERKETIEFLLHRLSEIKYV